MSRIRVKICGVKELSNALKAVECGADGIGFVFYEKSPRFIEVEKSREIIKNLPALINKVGVFVNHSLPEIIKITEVTGIDTIQLHGNYNMEFVRSLLNKTKLPIIYAIRIEKISDFTPENNHINELSQLVSCILLDRFDKNEYGGTGKTIFFENINLKDTSLAFLSKKVILAGGINKDNVIKIVSTLKPYGIDVSSGVEIEKGVKDNKLIEEFFEVLKGRDVYQNQH